MTEFEELIQFEQNLTKYERILASFEVWLTHDYCKNKRTIDNIAKVFETAKKYHTQYIKPYLEYNYLDDLTSSQRITKRMIAFPNNCYINICALVNKAILERN